MRRRRNFGPCMEQRRERLISCLIGLCVLMVTLMACSLGSGTTTPISSSTSSSSTSSTTSSTTSATSLPATSVPATCATLLPGAGPATAGVGFGDVPFPSNSVSTAILPHSSGTGQWSIFLFNVCSSNSTVATAQTFFATQLPAHGWAQSATLPFNGSYPAACGDPYCWGKDTAPRFVGLENVTNAGSSNITYRIRLFTPPPIPQCPVGPYAGPSGPFAHWLLSSSVGVAAPPLGEHGPASGFDQNGYAQDPGDNMCVAGNAASVTAFFNFTLPFLGWAHGSAPSGCLVSTTGTVWRKGMNMIAIDAAGGSSVPNGYSFSYSACIHL
jgi:hypothetical protein